MLWGALQTMRLLEEYVEYGWSSHPKIAMIIAMSSMQKEGIAMRGIQMELQRQNGQSMLVKKRVKKLEAR